MSHHKEPEKHEKQKDREYAPEPFREPDSGPRHPKEALPPADPFPTEKAVVFGDASATYGSMVAPEVIRPATSVSHPGPQKEEHSKETKEAADHTVEAAQATVKELRAEQHSREHKK